MLDAVYDELVDAIREGVEAIAAGDPFDEFVQMLQMIRESDASRVCEWIEEAVASVANVLCGGGRDWGIRAARAVR